MDLNLLRDAPQSRRSLTSNHNQTSRSDIDDHGSIASQERLARWSLREYIAMALTMPQLLRLPATLRRQVLSNASFLLRPVESQQHQCQTRLLLQRSYAQGKAPPKPTVRRPAPASSSPPKPRAAPSKANYTGNPYAERLLGSADQVLLYNSANHTGYVIICYLTGAIFLVGATAMVSLTERPSTTGDSPNNASPKPPTPFWTRILNAIPAIMFATMGTVALLAPTKMIRRIWLLKPPPTSPNEYQLQIETKSSLPFLFRRHGRTLTAQLPNVSIDRSIRSSPADLTWHNVPLTSSAAFSAHYLPSTHPSHVRGAPPATPLSARLRGFNAGMLDAWPSLVRNVKRMFVREGMAYVHVIGEDGQWKVDLHEAEVLDGGKPVGTLMATDVAMAKGVVPWVQRLMGKVDAVGR